MPVTYEPIATNTLGSDTSSVTLSSISGSYTDIVLSVLTKVTSPGGATFLTFNSDTATNYSNTRILGDGSNASSQRRTNNNYIVIDAPNTEWSSYVINLMNYSNTTTNKSCLIRSASTTYVTAVVGLWRSTSTITSITMTTDGGNFVSGSMFTLYGIKAA
jgi:hypothetical protein